MTPLGATALRVEWVDRSDDETGFEIERAPAATGPFGRVGIAAANAQAFDDAGLQPGTTYRHRLRALPLFVGSPPGGGSWSPSGYTPVVSAATGAAVGTPSGLAASGVTGTTATLAWTAASGAEGYAVDYAAGAAGPFTEAFRVGAVASTGLTGLAPGSPYAFRVRAPKGGASSPPSNVVTFTTPSTIVLRTTGDAVVMASTAVPANQRVNLPADVDSVGCYFQWVVGPSGQGLFHNCAITALRFDASALAGRTVTRARLVMWPCGRAPPARRPTAASAG